MTFGDALNLLKNGYGIRRTNWEEGNFIAFNEGKKSLQRMVPYYITEGIIVKKVKYIQP